jgi:hypothetical protein
MACLTRCTLCLGSRWSFKCRVLCLWLIIRDWSEAGHYFVEEFMNGVDLPFTEQPIKTVACSLGLVV